MMARAEVECKFLSGKFKTVSLRYLIGYSSVYNLHSVCNL